MTKRAHVNLYLDQAHHGMLLDLCRHLEMRETELLYELIRIQHARLVSYLRARPLPADHRLELTRNGDFTTYGPLPTTREEARKRLRHFYGAFLLEAGTASNLFRLANAGKVRPEKLLEEMVAHWTAQAMKGGNGSTTLPEGEEPNSD